MTTSLPIDPLLPAIVEALRQDSALVIEAPPGAGKTTRVPAALLAASGEGEILVLQPRRLPARLAAERVAEELGEAVGERVGYTVRFDERSGPRTRLRFVTEGIVVRRLLADPHLTGVAAVVLDEFHERHLATDLTLALLRALQEGPRPELRLAVMSATLEADPLREFLGGCPLIRTEGRTYPVELEHLPHADERPLPEQVAGAVRRLVQDGPEGDVLVFLPGAGEIRRCADALGPLAAAKGLTVLPLHGDLSPAEQNRAVRPSRERRVILSTNVAETSVTIEGVVAVVDSGLARIPAHSHWTGLPTLTVDKVSQASAIQRAGRAGRTRPGRALRLYTRHDLESRRAYEVPEVARLDLAEALLVLHAHGVTDPHAFPWFEPPPPASLAVASELLGRLGAVAGGRLTEVGRQMLRFPVHPRLARLVVEGERRGVGAAAAALAALVSEGDIADDARAAFGAHKSGGEGGDLLERLDRFEQARAARFASDRMRGLGVNARAAQAAERARRQLAAHIDEKAARPSSAAARDEALATATLSAFPDRVMRRRGAGATDAVLAAGGTARVGALPPEELLVAVDVEERASAGRRGPAGVTVRLAVGIQPEHLLDLLSDQLASTDEVVWNRETERAERVSRLSYGAIVLEETRRPAPPSPEASKLLGEAARAAGLGGGEDLATLGVRMALLRSALPEANVPAVDEGALAAALDAAAEGRTSLAELRALDLTGVWLSQLPAVGRLLREETPERIRLPGGRELPVHYEPGKPPWIESRLQDFFGSRAGPALCRGRVPLTLHLLAPNGRAVQVTSDLSGFWRQHYPAIRRELGRRYPRHSWPEDPATAAPPVRRPR